MKKLIFTIPLIFLFLNSFAQSAYEAQRKKVNNLLSNRSSKFGQYDESLTKRTGIFGLKTKKDMQRSINILTEIVQTDNEIFKELKILLDYKDLEKSQVQTRATETESRINAYMQTIKKLQQQNDKIKDEFAQVEEDHNKLNNILITIIVVIILAFLGLLATKKLTFR
jgi:chromosome segregation ATPase